MENDMKKHMQDIDIVDIMAIEREAEKEAKKEKKKQMELKRVQGLKYVAVPERKKEEIVREKYVERTQAGMQQAIDQRWLDREYNNIMNGT